MVKAVTTYIDRHGNTCMGHVIVSGNVIVDEKYNMTRMYIEEPAAFKAKHAFMGQGEYFILPDDAPEQVGFYSRKSHYEICKKYQKIGHLSADTNAYLSRMEYPDDAYMITWYSSGLKIDTGSHSSQKMLY